MRDAGSSDRLFEVDSLSFAAGVQYDMICKLFAINVESFGSGAGRVLRRRTCCVWWRMGCEAVDSSSSAVMYVAYMAMRYARNQSRRVCLW